MYRLKAGIKKVFETHEEELLLVEEHLRGMFASSVPYIPLIGRYLLDSGGKRLRPLFLILSAHLAGYRGRDHVALASVVEGIHTASLLHDDVVDEANLRRGKPAANSIWGNQLVILVGDFLYSSAVKYAVSFKNQRIMEALARATTRMTEGELFQLQKSGDIGLTEEEYMEIISAKTACLISSACRIGAILGGCSEVEEEALASFGLKTGLAFQMADDILDYMADENGLGKKLGKDLEEGKITLPLICLLKGVPPEEKEEIKEILSRGPSEEALKRTLELFRSKNVLEKSLDYARRLVDEAKEELLIFPSSPERDEMFDIAEYALQREK